MKEKKQKNINNILFHTPHGYYKIKGKTFTEIKELEKKNKGEKEND